MKLYFAPNACSLAPHIILRETNTDFSLIRVNNVSKRTADHQDFTQINPKGYVAALVLDNGQVLTEAPAILQYLADLNPEYDLAAPSGSWERIRQQEMLNFISSELHAGAAPLFNQQLPTSVQLLFSQKLRLRLDYLETLLTEHLFQSHDFSIVDAYLYTVLSWLPRFDIAISDWPRLEKYMQIIDNRPTVKAALQAEAATSPVD